MGSEGRCLSPPPARAQPRADCRGRHPNRDVGGPRRGLDEPRRARAGCRADVPVPPPHGQGRTARPHGRRGVRGRPAGARARRHVAAWPRPLGRRAPRRAAPPLVAGSRPDCRPAADAEPGAVVRARARMPARHAAAGGREAVDTTARQRLRPEPCDARGGPADRGAHLGPVAGARRRELQRPARAAHRRGALSGDPCPADGARPRGRRRHRGRLPVRLDRILDGIDVLVRGRS